MWLLTGKTLYFFTVLLTGSGSKMIDALFSALIIFVAINLETTIKKIIVFTIYIVLRCFAEVYKKDIQKQEVIEGIKKQLPTLLICEILGVLMLYSL